VETTPTVFEGVALKIRDFRDVGLEGWVKSQFGS